MLNQGPPPGDGDGGAGGGDKGDGGGDKGGGDKGGGKGDEGGGGGKGEKGVGKGGQGGGETDQGDEWSHLRRRVGGSPTGSGTGGGGKGGGGKGAEKGAKAPEEQTENRFPKAGFPPPPQTMNGSASLPWASAEAPVPPIPILSRNRSASAPRRGCTIEPATQVADQDPSGAAQVDDTSLALGMAHGGEWHQEDDDQDWGPTWRILARTQVFVCRRYSLLK
jgi:hypothetical protein